MFQTSVIEKIKTHLRFNYISFENREITCKNVEGPDRPQMTIWRMLIACWIPKITNAYVSICNTYSFYT